MVDGMDEYPPLKFTPEDQSRVERVPERTMNRRGPPDRVRLNSDRGPRSGREWHRSPRDEEKRESERDEKEASIPWEELQAEVDQANIRLRREDVPVTLHLHRHGGKNYLQTVDLRSGSVRRHFRVLEKDAVSRILGDLIEEAGFVVDTRI